MSPSLTAVHETVSRTLQLWLPQKFYRPSTSFKSEFPGEQWGKGVAFWGYGAVVDYLQLIVPTPKTLVKFQLVGAILENRIFRLFTSCRLDTR